MVSSTIASLVTLVTLRVQEHKHHIACPLLLSMVGFPETMRSSISDMRSRDDRILMQARRPQRMVILWTFSRINELNTLENLFFWRTPHLVRMTSYVKVDGEE